MMDIVLTLDTPTEEQLQKLCTEWQEILRLQDWDVSVSILRARDMSGGFREGEVSWTIERKEAAISILDPIDYPDNVIKPQEMETTLVHELLHLHFAPFDTFEAGTPQDTSVEQAIHAISAAMVNLKRK